MELFYSEDIDGNVVRLDEEESGHCVRVLRHRAGDEISVIDGRGRLMRCRIVGDRPKAVEAEVLSCIGNWNGHPYRLTMAVCPTKNIDRYEWFVEKATEMGVDVIAPVIGEHSERRAVKTQRLEKIVLSAAKQSLKGAVPHVAEPVAVRDFICGAGETSPDVSRDVCGEVCEDVSGEVPEEIPAKVHGEVPVSSSGTRRRSAGQQTLRLIACCFEDADHPRRSVKEALREHLDAALRKSGTCKPAAYEENTVHDGLPAVGDIPEITVLIGPEGDFSQEELRTALERGYIPVHLGPSRLRTETAALLCVGAVYAALVL